MPHDDALPAPSPRPEALLLTGTVGVGKTSTADLLGDLLADLGVPHAVIDLDRLCQAWPAPAEDPFQHRLLLANLRAVAHNHRAAGARLLVLAGVAENTAERDAYQDALGVPLRVCRLTANLPAVRARLRARHEADHDTASLPWHLERAEELHRVLEAAGISDLTVDTTHLTPARTAAAVLEAAHWNTAATATPATADQPSGRHQHLRFFFEYGVDTPLWPGSPDHPDLDSPYGSPCEPELLPITPATRDELTRLADRYQSSLDWDDPGGPSLWTPDQWESFRTAADAALAALRHDLGDGWTVTDRRS